MAIQLLDAMDPQTESELLSEAAERHLPRHSWLFHEGEWTDDVYLVVSGLIKLLKTAADGSEAVLSIRGAGDVVGELSAIDARPRLVSAMTVTDTSVISIGRARLLAVMRQRPDLAHALLAGLTGQLRSVALHTIALASGDASVLVARRIYQLASDPVFAPIRSDGLGLLVIAMPVSQRELATWAGVSHRSVAGVLGQLRDDDIITTSRLQLQVLDLGRLRTCAETHVAVSPR